MKNYGNLLQTKIKMSESKLPKDWKIKPLGEVCKLKNGYAFKSDNYLHKGVPVIRISDIKNGLIVPRNTVHVSENSIYDSYIINENEIIVAMSGATTGKFGIYKSKEKAYQNQRVGKFDIIDKTLLDNNFLLHQLHSLKRQIEKDAYGGAQPNISSKKIEEMEIVLPPIETQQAIVSKIEELFSELDKGIEDLKTAQQQLKTYRQSVLKWAFEGKLTNENVKDGELPKGWEILNIDQIGKIKGGKRLPKGHYYSEEPTDYVYIMAGNLKDGTVKNKSTFLNKETYDALANYKVIGGEVYITIVGACIGDAGIIPDNIGKSILTENAAKIIELKNTYNKYLALWINSTICQSNIKRKILSATLGKLALNRIGTLEIPLAPLEEQHQIVQEIESRLSVADKMEESIAKSLQQAEALRQSILKKAFSGELV